MATLITTVQLLSERHWILDRLAAEGMQLDITASAYRHAAIAFDRLNMPEQVTEACADGLRASRAAVKVHQIMLQLAFGYSALRMPHTQDHHLSL